MDVHLSTKFPDADVMLSSRQFCNLLLTLCVTLGSAMAWAGEHGEGEKKEGGSEPGAIYYNLYPPFVLNVLVPTGKKSRFLKVDVTLRMRDNNAQEQVRRHLPHIRNDLIMALGGQTEETLTNVEAREILRQQALKAIQELIEKEEGNQGVIDLLFMNFVVQR